MDYVHIDELVFQGRHGILPKEKTDPQEFKVSLKLGTDTSAAGASDKIGDALDYRVFKDIVQTTIEGKHQNLLETLAEVIATEILNDPRILSAEVTVKKLHIWNNGVPGVTVFRENN